MERQFDQVLPEMVATLQRRAQAARDVGSGGDVAEVRAAFVGPEGQTVVARLRLDVWSPREGIDSALPCVLV